MTDTPLFYEGKGNWTSTPQGGGSEQSGDVIVLIGDGTRSSGYAQFQSVDPDAGDVPASFTWDADGVHIVEDCVVTFAGTWNKGGSNAQFYVAVLRDGDEVGPYWNLVQACTVGGATIGLTFTFLAGDVVTIASDQNGSGSALTACRIA